jgi:chaperone modulatory protein CbpM
MTMDRREFLVRARIDSDAMDLWVDAGWLAPRGAIGEWTFSEIDLARARLIRDLTGDLGVNDEGIPIILGLIDQLHGLRRALGELLVAVRAQPTNTRERLATELRAVRLQRDGYATLEGPQAT